MQALLTYLAELEFKAASGRLYWLPLFFDVPTKNHASSELELFRAGLAQNYTVLRVSGPALVVEDVNGEFIGEYIEARSRGRVAILEANLWAMQDLPGSLLAFDPGLTLSQERAAIPFESTVIGRLVETRRFPVHVLLEGGLPSLRDVLIVNLEVLTGASA